MSRVLVCFLAATALFAPGQEESSGTVPLRLIVLNSAAEAGKVRIALRNGADFAVLAREKSSDATSVDGGLLGRVDPSTLREEMRAAIRGLGPGHLSPVFHLPSGYAIAKVLAPDELTGMEDARLARQAAIRAEGSIRFDLNLSGLSEADAALANFSKPAGWNLDLSRACAMRRESLGDVTARAEKLVAAADPNRSPSDAMSLHVALGQIDTYRGEMDQAIAQFEAAYRIGSAAEPRAIPEFEELLGVAWLHRSEMANDVYRHPGERCIFPIRPEFKFLKTADSPKAVDHLLASLKARPDDIETKWLLNLAYMTLGNYPAGVPKEHLFAPSLFASAEDIGSFRDVAPRTGLNLMSEAGGLIVDDFDNDDLLDVVTSSWDFCAPMHFFHNNGDGTFTDRSAQSGPDKQLGGLSIIQTDYNNDGCLDILVLRGGWQIAQRKSLLRNNCDTSGGRTTPIP